MRPSCTCLALDLLRFVEKRKIELKGSYTSSRRPLQKITNLLYSINLLYWYKSTNSRLKAEVASSAGEPPHAGDEAMSVGAAAGGAMEGVEEEDAPVSARIAPFGVTHFAKPTHVLYLSISLFFF